MKKTSLFICLITMLLFVGCGGGGGGGDDSPQNLTVSQESPLVNAVNVPVKAIISAVFSQTMASETLNTMSFLVDSSGGPISGSVVCTGSTVSFLPDAPLTYNTLYTATITTEAQSLVGSTLVSEHSWSFTTVAVGPGDPDNYIPFTQGSSWTYQGTLTEGNNPPLSYTNTRSIKGTAVVDGKTATIFIESNPDNLGEMDAYLYKDLDGITDYGDSSSDPLMQQIIPYQEINFPTSVGDSYVQLHKAGLDSGLDEDGDGINERVDFLSRLTFVSLDTVTVPTGTYLNCAQIKAEIQITIINSHDSASYTFQSTDSYWYAPGIGRVKYTSVFEYSDGSTDTVEEVLTGYFSIFADDLAVADSNTESPGKPAVGYDGTNFLVVTRKVISWNDSTMSGVLVDNNGEPLKTLDIATADTEGGFMTSNRSAVTYGKDFYLVVFGQNGQIAGQRVTSTGQVLDGLSGFAITSTDLNFQPDVAFDGNNFLAVWGKYINDSSDIYGAIITPDGQVLEEFPIYSGPGEQISPSIAFDGNNYLIAWQDTRSGSGPSDDTDIYASRVTPGAVVLEPLGIPICSIPGYQGAPDLVYGGNNYFVVWEDGRVFAGETGQLPGVDIYGTRISTNGNVLDGGGIPINTKTYMAFDGKANPTVAFVGADYFVSWQAGSFPNYAPAGIFAAWVSTAGQIVDSSPGDVGISISGPPSTATIYVYPVAKDGGDNILITWINNTELFGTNKDIRGVVVPGL